MHTVLSHTQVQLTIIMGVKLWQLELVEHCWEVSPHMRNIDTTGNALKAAVEGQVLTKPTPNLVKMNIMPCRRLHLLRVVRAV